MPLYVVCEAVGTSPRNTLRARKQLTSHLLLIVTGSSRGIGASVALRLAQHGASVTINYVSSASRAEEVAEKARSAGVKAITVKADVTKKEELAQLFERTKKELGRVDIVMSNSGIEHFGSLSDVKEDEIDAVFAVNVKAQYFVAQMAEKHMEDGGRLMLISSVSAVMVGPPFSLFFFFPLSSSLLSSFA